MESVSTTREPEQTVDAEPGWRTTIVRRSDDRLVAGLASGVAAALGIRPVYVRAGFVVLAFAGGVGILLYTAGWALFPDDTAVDPPEPRPPATRRQQFGLALVFIGLLFGLESVGLWFGDAVVIPVALVSFGVAAVWDRGRYDYRSALTQITGSDGREERPSRLRMIFGGLLMFSGAVVLFNAVDAFEGMGEIALAVAVTAVGFLLVFGPWVWRLIDDLAKERRERIRSEERAEVAAHLHDSVLQTLALIQRSDDPKRMVTLARAQERALRAWLFSTTDTNSADSLRTALEAAAGRVEAAHDLPVSVVVVGDLPLSERTEALAQASAEAMTNAAKHSGAEQISVYAEAASNKAEVWISDQGKGFEMDDVPTERLGIRESIVGRMERHRGIAEIDSTGEGTEIHLKMEGLET
jgi:signal transduction histidine kinase/phage shock protein PspC (stress-responsive transcriptional regulator)